MARARSRRLRTKVKELGADDSVSYFQRSMSHARSSNRRKRERGISISLTFTMMLLLIVITSASISAFEWLWDGFLNSRIFTLREISVHGNRRISSADIIDASNLRVGTDSIYSIMPHIVEKRIKARFRYVKQVFVQRRAIHEQNEGIYGLVDIEVEERKPFALVDGVGSFMFIDDQGFILEEVRVEAKPEGASPLSKSQGSRGRPSPSPLTPGNAWESSPAADFKSPRENMPLILGVDGRTLKSNMQSKSGMADVTACSTFGMALDVLVSARSVIPELFDKISCVDARDPDNIALHLREIAKGGEHGKVTIRLASDRIREGLGDILPVIMKRREENRKTSYIDARFHGAIYCGEETY